MEGVGRERVERVGEMEEVGKVWVDLEEGEGGGNGGEEEEEVEGV